MRGKPPCYPRREDSGTAEPIVDGARILRAAFVRVRDGHGHALRSPEDVQVLPVPQRGPRCVAQLLAFAYEIERRIADGDVADRAAVARELGVTRARITQILDLALLAPDVQEEILEAEVEPGHDPISERALRWVVRARDWPTQRARWRDLNAV